MAQKSRDYWKKRFEQIEQIEHGQGAKCYADIERLYRQAQRKIEGQIEAWYGRFADNNGITLTEAKRLLTTKELAELKWDVQEYIRYGQENAINGHWVKQLENASARYHINRLESLKLQTQQSLEVLFGNQADSIDQTMRAIYKDGFYRTAFEVQKGFGVGWDFGTLDEKQISKIINKPWAADGKNFSARIWDNKQKLLNELNTTLTQGVVLGQDPQKTIDTIARKMNTSKKNAGRLVMTEQAFFSETAQHDSFGELGVEMYEIVATLDSHTSEICQDMDGKTFKMSEWSVGETAPPFHVNCRSTTVPAFGDEFDLIGERAARGEDGKTYYVPGDMTYKQWQKSFVEGDKSDLKEVKSDDIMKDNTEETLKIKVDNFLDGTNSDRESLGEAILKEYGVEGVSVNVKAMIQSGYCNVIPDNGTLNVVDYNLNTNDRRSAKYQVKTAFHEAYHASGNGYATDYGTMDTTRWLNLEETFAETSAHYKSSLFGITDLTPAYPDKLVSMLPRLKQLPEFSACNTLGDFGKVALEARMNGGGSTWKQLSKAAMRKKFSFGDYVPQYFEEIRGDVSGYVEKIIENMPESVNYKDAMIADLEAAMKNVEKFGHTLSDNESRMLNNAVAVAMNRIGVK